MWENEWERRANKDGSGEQAQSSTFATYTRTLTHTDTRNGKYRSLNAVTTSASTQERTIQDNKTPIRHTLIIKSASFN